MSVIATKQEFYSQYNKGLLGNHLRNWTVAEWREFDDIGWYPVDSIAVRCKVPGKPYVRYNLRPEKALAWVLAICKKERWTEDQFQFAEAAPDHCNTLQAEVMRDERYLYLRYVLHGHERMRYSFDGSEKHTWGLEALHLLQRWMDSSSYAFLMDLFDRYPDAVVEFCCYPHSVGEFKWNTLFWEVRNY